MQKKCWNGSRRCLELRIRAMLAKLTDRVEQLLITFCFNEKSGSFTVFVVSILFPETHIIRNTYYYEYNFQEKSYIYNISNIHSIFFFRYSYSRTSWCLGGNCRGVAAWIPLNSLFQPLKIRQMSIWMKFQRNFWCNFRKAPWFLRVHLMILVILLYFCDML